MGKIIKNAIQSSRSRSREDCMVEIITTVASVITAVGVIIGVAIGAFKWFLKQEKQDIDIVAMKEEQTVLTHGVLACLKGLKEQGGDGPVTEAIDQIEDFINKRAHK